MSALRDRLKTSRAASLRREDRRSPAARLERAARPRALQADRVGHAHGASGPRVRPPRPRSQPRRARRWRPTRSLCRRTATTNLLSLAERARDEGDFVIGEVRFDAWANDLLGLTLTDPTTGLRREPKNASETCLAAFEGAVSLPWPSPSHAAELGAWMRRPPALRRRPTSWGMRHASRRSSYADSRRAGRRRHAVIDTDDARRAGLLAGRVRRALAFAGEPSTTSLPSAIASRVAELFTE